MSQVETLRKWRDETSAEANYTSALFIADKIYAMTKNSGDALALAKILFDDQQYLRAAHTLKDPALSRNLACRRLSCRALLRANKYDEALELVLDTDATLLHLSGDIWCRKNNFTKAKAAYLGAVRLDPLCFEAFDKLIANNLLTDSEQRQLVQQLDFAPQGDCSDFFKSLYLAKLSKSISNDQLARDGLDHLEDVYSLGDTCDLLQARAELSINQCRFEEARDLCEKILRADPYCYSAYDLYITALYEVNDTNTLFKIGHKLAEDVPDSAISCVAVGAYYMAIGNTTESRHQFSKATLADSTCISAWLGFAHTFANESEHERAITAYSTAARLFPGSHRPYLFLGMQYLSLNNLDVSQEYFTIASEICEQSDPFLLSELAVLAYNKRDLKLAEEIAVQSIEACERFKSDLKAVLPIKSNYAHILRRLGRNNEALAIFEEVAQSSKQDHTIYSSLGIVHQNLGNMDEAISFYNKALSVRPTDAVATELLNKAMKSMLDAAI